MIRFRKQIICLLLAFLAITPAGCNLLNAIPAPAPAPAPDDKPQPQPGPQPEPAPQPKFTEADYWKELAAAVESGSFLNTDQVVLTAKRLADRGLLKDLSRLDGIKAKRTEITEANKADIAKTIRGT
jgi:hypothetical protein